MDHPSSLIFKEYDNSNECVSDYMLMSYEQLVSYSLWSKVFGQNDFLLYISCKTTFFKNIIPKSTLVSFEFGL